VVTSRKGAKAGRHRVPKKGRRKVKYLTKRFQRNRLLTTAGKSDRPDSIRKEKHVKDWRLKERGMSDNPEKKKQE